MNIHVVQTGETIDSIAELYGVSALKLIQDNEIMNPTDLVPGQTIVIVYPELTYTVQDGDTLESITDAFGITLFQLLRNNPFLSERESIYPGETLVIRYHTNGQTNTIGFSYPFIKENILRKTLPFLTYLSVFNYRAAEGGEIVSYYDDTQIIKLIKEYDTIPLILLTTLTAQGEPNIEIAYNILLNEEYQNRQIYNILKIINEKGYYGVNLVFNYMSTSNQNLYQNFIARVSNRLWQEGYLVFVTINPNIKNVDSEIVFEKIDYTGISNSVNSVTFLQFIWGLNYGPPKPVTSILNLKTFVDYAVTRVPSDKFIIGMPILAYDWQLANIQADQNAFSLTIDAALSLARDFEAEIQFDEISQTPFFYYTQSNIGFPNQHMVWFIDARSINALLQLITDYGLNGTGIWNIMVYSPQLWLMINSQYEIVKFSNVD